MIENRFTEEQLNKVQGHLNEIGVFNKIESNEDNKVFIDRLRKLVDDVRSIDEAQVPTDLYLMGVLKKQCWMTPCCEATYNLTAKECLLAA